MNEEQLAMNFWGRIEQAQKLENRNNLSEICKAIKVPYQTIINQKSAARLPSLEVASLFAGELHCSLDWLILGSENNVKLENENQLSRQILSDPRKKAIVEKVANLSQSELFAIEVFLQIRH